MAPRTNGATTADGRSIGQLLSDLLHQGSVLLQEEVALARTEMSTKLRNAGRSIGMIAGGGLLKASLGRTNSGMGNMPTTYQTPAYSADSVDPVIDEEEAVPGTLGNRYGNGA